jgi:hypothetical protein
MAYQKKIVLHCPQGYNEKVDAMVEDFIRDGVYLVAVVGNDCDKVEDIIDELVVGDGSDESRYILTSSHPGETIDEVVAFAKSLTGEYSDSEVQVVEL